MKKIDPKMVMVAVLFILCLPGLLVTVAIEGVVMGFNKILAFFTTRKFDPKVVSNAALYALTLPEIIRAAVFRYIIKLFRK